MFYVCFLYFRGDRSDKSSLARGRRSSREKGNNQGVENFRFINILKLFFYIFSITLLYLFIPIRFLPTTFTHTHTHDPRPLPTTRASDISRKKKQNFAGFSGANSRKNRSISRDFRGKKVKIRGKIGRFQVFLLEKSQNS